MPDNESPIYVTDTHSLIWYLTDSPKLSFAANRSFKEIEEGKAKLLIPAIVIAEIIYIVERGKVEADLNNLIKRIQEAHNFEFSPLEFNQLLCLKDQTEIHEMHDQLIVCEALLSGAKIIIKDKKIRDSGFVKVLW